MDAFYRTFFGLAALLLLANCGARPEEKHTIEAVELLVSDGDNQRWAYQIDPRGQVQALHLQCRPRDSAVYRFALSEFQRQQVLTLAEGVVGLDSMAANVSNLLPSHHTIHKVVVFRTGQPVFSYNNEDRRSYDDPTEILNRLVTILRRADESQPKQPCAKAFSAPVLTQGYEYLLYLPPFCQPAGPSSEN